MAKATPQAGRLAQTAWGILILVGMGLVVAHLVWATRVARAPSERLIDQTFTKRGAGR